MARYHIRRGISIFSAICVWLAAFIQTFEAFRPDLTGDDFPDGFSPQGLSTLDPTAIRALWNYRRSQLYTDVAIDLLFAVGLFGLSYCVLCLKRVFKRYKGGESDLPSFMVLCFFIGAVLPSIQVMESIGATAMASAMISTPGYPDVGFQAVQVAHLLQQGSGLFFISAQFLFVSMGLAITSHLSFQTGELPVHHARMGAITSAMGFLVFIFEIVVIFTGGIPAIAGIFGIATLLFGFVLLPSWLIWLGVELVRLKKEAEVSRNAGDDSSLRSL
jgi:hypothetical protein